MFLTLIILIIGFGVLITGANILVNGSAALARRFNISELAIGLTIVAFGTSAPELVVSIVASKKELNDVVLGNVVGSNIFNLLFVLGVSGILLPIFVQSQTVWREIPFAFLAVGVILILANNFLGFKSAGIGRVDGIILLIFFIGFLTYIYFNLKSTQAVGNDEVKQQPLFYSVVFIILGLVGLIAGGQLVVNKSVEIARYFSLSEKLIGLTIVSIGTSLPELTTSVIAALKKKSDLAIGNVIGSNIFNIFLILGISSLISPIQYNIALNADIILLGAATLLVFIAMFTGVKKKLDRWEAFILILVFVGYLIFIIKRN